MKKLCKHSRCLMIVVILALITIITLYGLIR
jgi:hypothetical protein